MTARNDTVRLRAGAPGVHLDRLATGWRLHGWVVGFFTLLTLILTYPLVLHMTDSVIGEIGDNIYFVFLIRWYQQAWFELGISPFFHPWLNYPQGWNLASTDTSLATTLFGLSVGMLAGPVMGYNVAMLVTFVFSGWAMFFWVRRLTGSIPAGLVAGTIYAFLPYRVAHFLAGHMNLSGAQWFPLYFMGLYDLLRSTREAQGSWWKSAALAAVSLGLIGFTSMYYLYMTLLISAVFVAAYWLWGDRQSLGNRMLWKRLGALAAMACLPVLAAILPFVNFNNQGGLASRPFNYVSMYSASPTDFVLPPVFHYLWGSWIGAQVDRSLWVEASLYIGLVSSVLAVIAWVGRKHSPHLPLLKTGLVVMIVALILAMGTDLHWLSQQVQVPVPEFLQGLLHREQTMIPLPGLVLFLYLPFYAKMRALMRVGFFVLFFATVFAGLGAGRLFQQAGPQRRVSLAVCLLALVLLDFYPGPFEKFSKVEARPVDYWLAQQPGQGAVVQFPFEQSEDQDKVYFTLVHKKPYVGGFFSANQPEQYLRLQPWLKSFPNREGYDMMREMGVQWLLFDINEYPDLAAIEPHLKNLNIRYVTTVGTQAVYELQSP